MPKVKTHSATKKRFKRVGKGSKVKRSGAYRRHLLTKKTRKRKRDLRSALYVSAADVSIFKVLLPYR
ncbi:50S ribosomal protein L35 [Candidatus Dependentiae bacterium]